MDWILQNSTSILWLVPLAAFPIMVALKNLERSQAIIGTIVSLAVSVLAVWVWCTFPDEGDILKQNNWAWANKLGSSYHVGMDQTSILAAAILTIVCWLYQLALPVRQQMTSKRAWIMLLESSILLLIVSLDGMLFAIAYLVSIAALYMLASPWSKSAKYLISVEILLYMLSCSSFAYMHAITSSSNFFTWIETTIPLIHQYLLLPLLAATFLLRLSVWPFSIHASTQCPQDSPTSTLIHPLGLIIGFTAIYRWCTLLFPAALVSYQKWLVWWGLAAAAISSVKLLTDKSSPVTQNMVSYFSGLLIAALAGLSHEGLVAAIVIFIGAALTTSLITCMSCCTRDYIKIHPLLTITLAGAPPSIILIGYYLLTVALLKVSLAHTITFLITATLMLRTLLDKMQFIQPHLSTVHSKVVNRINLTIVLLVLTGSITFGAISDKIDDSAQYWIALVNRAITYENTAKPPLEK